MAFDTVSKLVFNLRLGEGVFDEFDSACCGVDGGAYADWYNAAFVSLPYGDTEAGWFLQSF